MTHTLSPEATDNRKSEKTLPAPPRESGEEKQALRWAVRMLQSLSADNKTAPHPIGRELIAGRGPSGNNTMTIDDPHLSRQHIRLVVDQFGTLRLKDLESTNGTILNGRPIEAAQLAEGDLIRIGSALLVVTRLPEEEPVEDPGAGLVGDSPDFRATVQRAALAADSDLPILLLGATGTGKEVLARLVHERSGRTGRFVAVNCAAIPPDLAEAHLFGHQAGAYTGADKARLGLFREADGGTLFLDEIGDLPLAMQPQLLRALEESEILPVGASRPAHVDVRVVAATNVDLEKGVETGTFRPDLFARLSPWKVSLPPLRERREDVLRLARHFAGRAPEPRLGEAPLWTSDFAQALLIYPWPYNVRELRQLISSLEVSGQHAPYRVSMLPPDMRAVTNDLLPPMPDTASEQPHGGRSHGDHATTIDIQLPAGRHGRPNRDQLVLVLERHHYNISAVARHFERDRKQVYRWMKRLGIEMEPWAQ